MKASQKSFDCVAMKSEIQRKIQQEFGSLPEDEAAAAQWQKVLSDPILGPIVERISNRKKADSSGE